MIASQNGLLTKSTALFVEKILKNKLIC